MKVSFYSNDDLPLEYVQMYSNHAFAINKSTGKIEQLDFVNNYSKPIKFLRDEVDGKYLLQNGGL